MLIQLQRGSYIEMSASMLTYQMLTNVAFVWGFYFGIVLVKYYQ